MPVISTRKAHLMATLTNYFRIIRVDFTVKGASRAITPLKRWVRVDNFKLFKPLILFIHFIVKDFLEYLLSEFYFTVFLLFYKLKVHCSSQLFQKKIYFRL